MNFTETEIEEYALGKKPFPPELLKMLDYNINHFNQYLFVDTESISENNRILSKYFSAALKKQLEVVIPKIVAKYGEFPIKTTDNEFPVHMQAMAQLMMKHGVKLSKLNNLSVALFTHNICSVLSNETNSDIDGFFNDSNWGIMTMVVDKSLNEAGHTTVEDKVLLSSGLVGRREESQFVELLEKWLDTMPLEKLRLPEIASEGKMHFYINAGLQRSLSECIIESAQSESSLFILDREKVKNLLTTYNLTELIWDLLNEDAQKIKPIYDTCNSLELSDTQTKQYMRQSLMNNSMNTTADLSELTL